MPNWDAIKQEYITSDIGLRPLAAEHGVSFNTMKVRAKKELWNECRKEYVKRIGIEAIKNLPQDTTIVPHTTECGEVSLYIPAPTEQQVNRTSKVIEVSDKLLDIVEEMMEARSYRPSDIKYFSGALKDIKEVQMLKTALDDLEQQARIDKLRADAKQQEKDEVKVVRMIIEGDEDE